MKIQQLYIPTFAHMLLAFLLALIVVWYQTQDSDNSPQMRTGDSYIYLSTAKDLIDKGVFTNGGFGITFPAKGSEGQGMFFTPVYPAFVAMVMKIDQGFYERAGCHVASSNKTAAMECGNDYQTLIIIQTIISALSGFLIWLTAYLLTKNLTLSWLALSIGLLSGVYGSYATQIMTEVLLFPLFALASLLAALAWQSRQVFKKSGLLWIFSGLVFGIATLTRPAYSYLIYCSFFFLFFLTLYVTKEGVLKSLRFPLLLLMGFALSVGPWVLRNGLATGNYAISEGYAPYILVQRLAYNDMSWKEWSASFIYRLPDFGDKLADKFFGEKTHDRFDYGAKEGFFYIGHTSFRKQIDTEAGGKDQVMAYALKEYLLPNLPKHIMVTLSMVFNGIWIGKYWALSVIPLFFIGLFIAFKRKWPEFIIFSFPGWFMLGFHGFTSVNVTRYNMTLVPCLSLAAAWVLILFFSWLKTHISKTE